MTFLHARRALLCAAIAALAVASPHCGSQSVGASVKAPLTYRLTPAQTKINFTLHTTVHTVHGQFDLTSGEVKIDPVSGAISGEIVVDARTGRSGSDMRDARMKDDILEVGKYPQISFRPDRITNFDPSRSDLQATVHGIFSIHGADHELTVPVQIKFQGGTWTASATFTIPYVDWGMHDASRAFLHASHEAEVEVEFSGNTSQLAGH